MCCHSGQHSEMELKHVDTWTEIALSVSHIIHTILNHQEGGIRVHFHWFKNKKYRKTVTRVLLRCADLH